METILENVEMFKQIMKMIAAEFDKKCEVVLHDWSKSYESTIIAIENGAVTGRKIGECGSNLGLEVMRGIVEDSDRYNYITQTKSGKTLRSSTMYIRNTKNQIIGALCINFDISDFIVAESTIKSITMNNVDSGIKEIFANDINELLDYLINDSIRIVGRPISQMTKEDKIKAIEYLDQKGAFLITKSGGKICEYFDISKFTLYNYLDEIRSKIKK